MTLCVSVDSKAFYCYVIELLTLYINMDVCNRKVVFWVLKDYFAVYLNNKYII